MTVTAHHRQHANARLVYIHPDFDSYTLTADISIVVVSVPAVTSQYSLFFTIHNNSMVSFLISQLREPLNVTRYAQLPDIISGPIDDNSTTKVLDCVVVARRWMTPYYYIPVNVMYGLKACRESFEYTCYYYYIYIMCLSVIL